MGECRALLRQIRDLIGQFLARGEPWSDDTYWSDESGWSEP